MLVQTIGNMLPAALAVALSPFPVIAVVLVLATPRARTNGVMFAIGWLVGLSVVAAVVVLVFGGADDPESGSSLLVDLLKVAGGAALIGLGGRKWVTRPRNGAEPEMPGWMASIETLEPLRALGLGAVLGGANPKNFALTASAATSIAQAGLEGGDAVLAVVAFVALASVMVVGSVAYFVVAPESATRALEPVKSFMLTNNAVIMMVVFLLLGANILGNGIGGLAA